MKRLWLLAVGSLLTAMWIWQAVLGDLSPVEARLKNWPRSPVVKDRNDRVLSAFLSEDQEFCLPVPLEKMGSWIVPAVIETEDRRFWSHSGIDWLRLLRAMGEHLTGRGRSGASTLTSQVIRLCCPSPRTVKTKLREFAQARALEQRMTKEQILELYLNRVPLGGNLRGIEAAARGWFGRPARDLSLGQAAMLAAMLKGPTAYRPDVNPRRAMERRDKILAVLAERKIITEQQRRMAVMEPLPEKLHDMPSENWLFCRHVLDASGELEVTSTLDRRLQGIVKSALAAALTEQDPEVTACAVLMENSTGAIRAYEANARWATNRPGSWVDCANSRRSPGSALKPFVYAMAFEEGRLSPASLMADTPLTLSGRAPRNFDRLYRGPVSAAAALTDSLNLPAVRALRMVEGERLLVRLRRLGLPLKEHAGHYGDSLILGGCEVSPLELVQAASALARSGWSVSPIFSEGARPTQTEAFSPESAWLTTQILADPQRLPALLRSMDQLRGRVAFKTGTSYGLRDAWTVGWNRDWTLAVWLGDPAGTAHPELVGLSAAAPAVLEIFRQLPLSDIGAPPDGIGWRQVCSLSGMTPSAACPSTAGEYFIKTISPAGTCQIHRIEGGRTVLRWPADLAAFMDAPRESGDPLSIASPLDGASYLLDQPGMRLLFRAEGSVECFWYLDGLYLGRSGEAPLAWEMTPGPHSLTVMDSRGRQNSVNFSVTPLSGDRSPDLPALLEIPEDS